MIDECTRERLAVAIEPYIMAQMISDTPYNLFVAQGEDAFRQARRPLGEQLRRVIQQQAVERIAEPGRLHNSRRSEGPSRGMAMRMQEGPAALRSASPAAEVRNNLGEDNGIMSGMTCRGRSGRSPARTAEAEMDEQHGQ